MIENDLADQGVTIGMYTGGRQAEYIAILTTGDEFRFLDDTDTAKPAISYSPSG